MIIKKLHCTYFVPGTFLTYQGILIPLILYNTTTTVGGQNSIIISRKVHPRGSRGAVSVQLLRGHSHIPSKGSDWYLNSGRLALVV